MKTKKIHLSKQFAVVAIVPVLCLIPFINKAFHIDDTVFLWCAKQIQANPFDFYGFIANWYGFQQPMYLINQNPPLVSYFIAFIAYLFGWSESILHGFFIIPAVFMSIGIFLLARFLCKDYAWLASLIAVLTPVFLISSTNIMSDILMLTFYVWAVVFWLYGVADKKSAYLFCAGFLIAISALTKYFGMTLIPLLLVYSLAKERNIGMWIIFLIIPGIVLVAYQVLTYLLYDNLLISNAANYAIFSGATSKILLLSYKFFTGLSVTGGCLIGMLFFVPLMWSRRVIFWVVFSLSIFTITLFFVESVRNVLLPNIKNDDYFLIVQYSLFVFSGAHILFFAFFDLWKNRTPESLLLFLWVWGTFFFANFINWTVNGRVILPMVPAAGVLVIRRLQEIQFSTSLPKMLMLILPLIPAGLLALSTTWADVSLANIQRSAAMAFNDELSEYPHKIWFQGHWGFQYYMEAFGANAVVFEKSRINMGDLIVIPTNNSNVIMLNRNQFHFVGKLKFMPLSWVGTMSARNSAGFYWGIYGPLPFSFGRIDPEEFQIFLAGNFPESADAVEYFAKYLKSDRN